MILSLVTNMIFFVCALAYGYRVSKALEEN
jgi:hypothetical protein